MKRLLAKRLLPLALCLLLTLSVCPAWAEEADDYSIFDVTDDVEIVWEDEEIIEVVNADGQVVEWTFPVALEDMNPTFVMLANKTMLLPKTFVPSPLVKMKSRKADKNGKNTNGGVRKVSGDFQLQSDCAAALVEMFEAAIDDGYKLYLKSAYRSWKTQNTMYTNRLKKNKGKDDGWVSKPGASDHQTGLGCDVLNYAWTQKDGMNEKFAQTAEAQWMAAHCHEYGFVIRYPKDKVAITEINYEPWHLRYVGVPVAAYMAENNLCLEEFCEQLWTAIDEYIARGGDRSRVEPFMQVSAEY